MNHTKTGAKLRAGATGMAGALAMLTAAAQPATAQTPAEFYKGKTINLYVGVSAGGIYSTFALILSKHMEKHMPGKPNIVLQHMPGAGGARAVTYVYNVAPKDGTAIITPNAGAATRILLGLAKPTYDPAKLIWVGGWGEAVNVITLLKDHAPVKSLAETKNTEIILGTIGKASNTYLIPSLVANTMGLKFKMITGYRGGAPIRLAIEKGEVQGWAGQWVGWKMARPDWVKSGRLINLVQLASKPAKDLPGVPTLSSLAKNDEEKKMYQLVETGIADLALAVPPGVPADRVKAIGEAYQKTLRDPEFLKDATARKFEIDPVPGEDIQKFVTDLMATPPDRVARIKKAMGLTN